MVTLLILYLVLFVQWLVVHPNSAVSIVVDAV